MQIPRDRVESSSKFVAVLFGAKRGENARTEFRVTTAYQNTEHQSLLFYLRFWSRILPKSSSGKWHGSNYF